MAFRMTDASTPLTAETTSTTEPPDAPSVKILLTHVESADLDAALAILARQVYEPFPQIVVVGAPSEVIPDGVDSRATLEDAIKSEGDGIDYFWILHSDARPRPDALGALISEVERNEASLGGSKLLRAGSHDVLESVGSATDVFGEPYSGLDEGEIDLQQYDVVREVAFVGSASMLVRRDLAQGLKGLDTLLPPIAAGLDFSQRTRLAGGRVIGVPSSEVYHQGRCEDRGADWREQAGRLRAMLTAYRLLTLLWVIPYDLLVSVVDTLANFLLLRWRPALRHLLSWSWNLIHLPSTIRHRYRFRSVRTAGDEELFRFQSRGSVRLREVGSELSARVLSVFDDDQAFARGSRRITSSPGIWGVVLAALVVAFGVRSLVFIGVPDVGFNFPFEAPSVALSRWFGGWNQSGLGTPAPVHPSIGLTGLLSWLWFGAEGATRALLTIGFGFVAVIGMGRFAGRLGLRGPGRYLAGLVLIAGPGTAVLTGSGSWLGLAAAAVLPWAVRAVFIYSEDHHSRTLSRLGWAVLFTIPVAAFSPLLVFGPFVVLLVWAILGGKDGGPLLAAASLLAGIVAVPFVLGDPGWVTDESRRLGLMVSDWWPVLAAVAVIPAVFLDATRRRMALMGGVLAGASLVVLRLPFGGPGVEEGLLVLASLGVAIIVSVGMDQISAQPRQLAGAIAALAILVFSVGDVADGRLGLRSGDVNQELAFSVSLAGPEGPDRMLLVSTDKRDIPGEARSGPGFWYRTVDGAGITLDQVWLGEPRLGDLALDEDLTEIATGAALRPGLALSPFAASWVVLSGPEFSLDQAFLAQIDLVPAPLDPGSRVYENPSAVPLAAGSDGIIWRRDGTGFSGEPGSGDIDLSLNYANGWSPDSRPAGWGTTVSAVDGSADFTGDTVDRALALSAIALLVAGLFAVAIGRWRH